MKIVHSFWSKPSLNRDAKLEKSNGGWRHPKYYYMSWALSCLSFKKCYGEIELVTDLEGKKMLIDQLELPYTSVKVELDLLNNYPVQLWAIGKLYTYGIQDTPFIHVDNDIYIWKKFGNRIENASLVAQHTDKEEHYSMALERLKHYNIKIPSLLTEDYQNHKEFNCSNVGIIGGTNYPFFKEYVHKAFQFVDGNLDNITDTLMGSTYALVYEQYLFSAMARKKRIEVQHLFEGKEEDIMDLTTFMNKYNQSKYVHLLANKKQFFGRCRELEQQLILEYPEYHSRILSLFGT
ncbi:MAG: DUF6734 family protein [Saonia sp.]